MLSSKAWKLSHEEKLKIRNQELIIKVGVIDHRRIKLWEDNPRMGEFIDNHKGVVDEEELENMLIEEEDVTTLAKEIEADGDYFRKVIENTDIIEKWGPINGNSLKVCPKGFDKNHPSIDLLRFKQFIYVKNFEDKKVFKKEFYGEIADYFKLLMPFHDYFSDVLTTNLDGQSIL